MRFIRAILWLSMAAVPALANLPSWDNSGNVLLSGASGQTYYFREVTYVDGDAAGDLNQATAVFGTITFNSNGTYSIPNATFTYYSQGQVGQQSVNTSGTFSFAASGYGFFTGPLTSAGLTYTNYGLVANGVLIASSTENQINSLFIAVPIGTPATVSSFQGSYQMAGFLPDTQASTVAGASFTLNPDGAGNLGTVNVNGYFAGGGTTAYSQSNSALKYSFSNGAGVLTWPTSSTANFFSGQEFLYVSPDRNFVFGGSPNWFDMIVGVKTGGAAPNFSGLYYEAGLDWDATQLNTSGSTFVDNYYGTEQVLAPQAGLPNGAIVGHDRIVYGNGFVDGLNYTNVYPTSISSTGYTVSSPPYQTQYTFTNGGGVRIGWGVGPSLGLSIALQAPTPTPSSGPYISPSGVVNAASYAPFTAGVSGGEIIAIYGSGLAPSLAQATTVPLPTTLNGVQVKINGVAAPIYYVSPTVVSVIVPYSASYQVTSGFPIAQIQLTNGSATSNTVTEFINQTTPGIFTQAANGLDPGSIYHATPTGFVAVTSSNPAKPGETVVAYISGMGATVPSVTEGTQSPTTSLTNTVANFSINVGGVEACGTDTGSTPCPYVGLAPGLVGVYQFNIPIPSSTASGSAVAEIFGPDSDNFQIDIPIGSSSSSSAVITSAPRLRSQSAKRAARMQPKLHPQLPTSR